MTGQCPYLENGRIIKSCNAAKTLFIPSIDRHLEYCSSEDHDRCSVLLGHVMRTKGPKAAKSRGVDCLSWAEK